MNFFKNCTYFLIGDTVKLLHIASNWKHGNTTTPQYRVDGLIIGKEYKITDVTPILKVVNGDQQFVSIDGLDTSYPCWCFSKA